VSSRILLDVDRWDRADAAAQDAAIADVASMLPAFDHARSERFSGRQLRIRKERCGACYGMGGNPAQSGNSDNDDCDVCNNTHEIEIKSETDPVSHRVAIFVHRDTGAEFVLVPGRLDLAASLVSRAPVLESAPSGFRDLSLHERRHVITRAGMFDLAFDNGTWPVHPFGLVDAGPSPRLVYPIAALVRAQSDAFHELIDEVGPIEPFMPPHGLVRTGYGTAAPPKTGPHIVAYSPDGKWLAVAWSHDVRISDAETGRQLSCLALARPTDTQPLHIAFSPDSMRVALASRHDIELYEVATGELLTRVGNGEIGWRSVAWAMDGRLVIAETTNAGKVAVFRLVDPETSETLRKSEWSTDGWDYLALATSLDGTRAVVSLRQDDALAVWDVTKWEVIARIVTDNINSIALGSEHVFVSRDRKVRVFRIDDGREHDLGPTPPSGVVGAAHGKRVVVWTWDKGVGVFDLTRGKKRPLSKLATGTLAFSPDGAHIATGVDGQTFVAVWRAPYRR
jgi:WD40 repeat protein